MIYFMLGLGLGLMWGSFIGFGLTVRGLRKAAKDYFDKEINAP